MGSFQRASPSFTLLTHDVHVSRGTKDEKHVAIIMQASPIVTAVFRGIGSEGNSIFSAPMKCVTRARCNEYECTSGATDAGN